MARKRTSRRQLDDDRETVPIRRRRRRWRRRFLVASALIVTFVVAGPSIVAKTPLRNLVLAGILPPGTAQIAARDAKFSWIAGQSLAGVILSDANGHKIAEVESLSTDRSLVALAANSRHLGKIVVVRPVVYLETNLGGSNLEEFAQRLADAAQRDYQRPDDASSPTLAELEVVDASIIGRDAATGQAWRVDQLSATVRPPAAIENAWDATGTGIIALTDSSFSEASRVVPDPGQPVVPDPGGLFSPSAGGRFKFHLSANDDGAQQLDLLADRLPLAALEPWLARVLPGVRLVGQASTDLKVAWEAPAATQAAPGSSSGPENERRFSATGKLDAADVRFTADALVGDLVELPTASIGIDASLVGARLAARQLAVRSDWLLADATGDFDLAELTSLTAGRLPASDAALTVRVDVPHLTRMLPRTLRLRPGVRVDSGSVEVSARSAREESVRHWTLTAAIENLRGADGERPIRWTDPVKAGADLAETPTGAQLQGLLLRAPFASLRADGGGGGLEGELEFDLEQLAAQLGQFVDLSAWQLHGTGKGKFSWRDTGPDKFAASADLDLLRIDVRRDRRVVWVDPKLHIELQSNGARHGDRAARLDAATILMRGTRDTVEAELLGPVDLAAASRDWFIRFKGDGPLDSWAGRLRPWVAAVPDELAGQSTVSARLRLSDGLVELEESQLSIRDFRTRLGQTEIVEPRIEAGGDFRWDAAARSIESREMQLASSTVAGKARGVLLRLADAGPPTLRGDAAFRGDLERLAVWAGLVGAADGLRPRGEAEGRLRLVSDAERATASLTLRSTKPFALVRSAPAAVPNPREPVVAWSDPNLQLAAELAYTQADDRLKLADLRLDGQTVKLSGSGAIDQLRGAGLVRGDINITYDAAELAKLLAGYLGPGVQFQGANAARLVAHGRLRPNSPPSQGGAFDSANSTASLPHWSRGWLITAEAGWNAANLYGLPLGAARLVANVHDGQIQFNPVDLAVGQGRLSAQPRVLLDPPPQQFQLAGGPLISKVAISAEVSDAMLKYAAPILASATRMSGSFSLFSDGVQMPLGDPRQARGAGRLTIHQLSIMPGAGLADIVTLIQRLEAISRGRPEGLLGAIAQPAAPLKGITMNERTIDVQVVDGRVYHRNLEFLIDDVPVRSYGSVGFDQTMELVIQVPIQAKWVGKEPALHRLVGQTIEIPVHGTITRWRIDERAVTNFLAQAAQSAVGGALENELNKALEGLFRRK
jgi:hypothetical protein